MVEGFYLRRPCSRTARLKVTFYIPAVFHAEERGRRRHRRKRAKEVVHGHHGRYRSTFVSNNGASRAFRKLTPKLTADARKQVCEGLVDTEESLFDEASTAVRVRDIRTLDVVVEELKFLASARQTCRIR